MNRNKILVSGLINVETTLQIESFPLNYFPVCYPFFKIRATVSGVGFNVAKALHTLGNTVSFISMIGSDNASETVFSELKKLSIPYENILTILKETPQSVILYDTQGKRQIHVDLKDIQETEYPLKNFEQAVKGCSAASLCNINFSRALLSCCHDAGIITATDVHVLSNIHDDYNRDFMNHSDILFASNEHIQHPEIFIRELSDTYKNKIIVVGLGADGAMLHIRNEHFTGKFPAQTLRPIKNTIGAGDALFSSFLHYFTKTGDAVHSLQKAILFASWKIGETGAAEGFLTELELEKIAGIL